VRASHERLDGKGYPDRLAGDEIPLGDRVVAVCDAYHAMVSDRPYRRALRHHVALAELRAGAGTQFDGAVVEAFAAVLAAQPAAVA
jgi:two-component system, cell cycle response regulator